LIFQTPDEWKFSDRQSLKCYAVRSLDKNRSKLATQDAKYVKNSKVKKTVYELVENYLMNKDKWIEEKINAAKDMFPIRRGELMNLRPEKREQAYKF
jgi:carbonic anhydrase